MRQGGREAKGKAQLKTELSRLTNKQPLTRKIPLGEVNSKKVLKDKKPVDAVTGSKLYRDRKVENALARNSDNQVSDDIILD